MKENPWDRRLAGLVKKFTKSSDVTAFRNEYHALINDASIQQDTLQMLRTGREYLEAWVADPPPSAEKAFEQWMHLYRNIDRLKVFLLQRFLAKFPRYDPNMVDWGTFALHCPRKDLVESLITGRRLAERELTKLAKQNPEEFFQSCLLDVLMQQHKLKNLPQVARQCVMAEDRGPSRCKKTQILAHCLVNDKAGLTLPHVLDYLSTHPEDRQEFFRLVLGHLPSAMAVVERLWPRPAASGGKAKRNASDVLAAARAAVVAACLEALEGSDPATARAASLVLAQVRLMDMIQGTGSAGSSASVEAMVCEPLGRLAAQWLREKDSRPSAEADFAIVLRAGELHRLVQEYFAQLPVNLDRTLDSPERALVFERHRGRKQVIDEIIGLLDSPLEETRLRNALEDALFNVGVRPLGEPGEKTSFQNRYHQATEPDVIPGDAVVIIQPGRILGELPEGFVLTKAKVRLASNLESPP